MNKNKIFLLTVMLLTVSCFMPVYGLENKKSVTLQKETMTDMANIWAEAWETRNGRPRYEMMSDDMKRKFEEEQDRLENGELNMSIRWSSPWVEDYTINVEDDSAEICYVMKVSTEEYYVMWEYIAFGINRQNNKTEVIAQNTSDLFEYDKSSGSVTDSLYGVSYGNIEESMLPDYTYFKLTDILRVMISAEYKYRDKFISAIDFMQTGLDNTGSLVTVDSNITATVRSLPSNPAKDEALKKVKEENINEYIRLFSEYMTETEVHYTLQAKVDLETEGIVSVALEKQK